MRLAIALMVALVALAGCGLTTTPVPAVSEGPSPTPSPSGPASPSPSPAFVPSSGVSECVSGDTMFTGTARGPKGDPIQLARAWLTGLHPSDALTTEPRPGSAVAVVVTRDGAQVGLLHMTPDPDGGWLLDEWTLCAGITYP